MNGWILAEVFHVRPGEVEEMIQRRLEEGAGTSRRRERKGCGLRRSAWVNNGWTLCQVSD
jgi:hypothetical protein